MKQTLSIITVIFIALIGLSSCAEDITTPNTPQYKDTFVVVNVYPTTTIINECTKLDRFPRLYDFYIHSLQNNYLFKNGSQFLIIKNNQEYELLKSAIEIECTNESENLFNYKPILPKVDLDSLDIVITLLNVSQVHRPTPKFDNLFKYNYLLNKVQLDTRILYKRNSMSMVRRESFEFTIDYIRKIKNFDDVEQKRIEIDE